MPVDYIRYDILTQEALRGVVRTVLVDAAKNGLPGDHHFYISFDTLAPGVNISSRLLAQYPKEMTVVLQHQFWDLIITDERFEVGLSFNGIAERLVIPFASIKGFFDPSVQFGLEFQVVTAGQGELDETGAAASTSPTGPKVPAADTSRPPARHEAPAAPPQPLPTPANPDPAADESASAGDTDGEPDRPSNGGGEVVRLDRFRKK
jgi:hypothetical protein